MKKTPNGRTPPKAKDIHINYENTDLKRRSEVLRSAENTEKTLKEFSNRPDIRKKQSNAKTARALTEKRYQELKPIIANMQSSLFNQIIEYSNTHSAEESIIFCQKLESGKIYTTNMMFWQNNLILNIRLIILIFLLIFLVTMPSF